MIDDSHLSTHRGGVALPRRPWLRRDTPVLWRTARSVQVGDGPRRVIVTDLPRPLLAWARTLRGERTMEECLATCPDRDAGLELIQLLTLSGALDDASRVPASIARLPRALRDRAQRHAAAARHTYADDRAHTSVDVRARSTVAVHGNGPLADAVRQVLRQSGIGTVLHAAPPSSAARTGRASSGSIDVHVLAHQWHPDSLDDAGCLALDIPHLPVSAWGAHAVIGPLVVPGRTPCLRCGLLQAQDNDPAFAALHLQRSQSQPDVHPLDSALALVVAGHAALQITAWLESTDRSPDLEAYRLHVRLPGGSTHREEFPPHPLCGCRWDPDEGS